MVLILGLGLGLGLGLPLILGFYFIATHLRAHLADDVKKIFGDSKVFLCFLPPNMTHFVQPIHAGLDRCTRVAVDNELDGWRMDQDNMSK